MVEKEKVMRGLECCYNDNCGACPYAAIVKCEHKLHKDTLAILKEQEPRVMTKSEVEQYVRIVPNAFLAFEVDDPPLYVEYKNYPQPLKWAIFSIVYSWMNDYEISLDYGKEFRFWTSRPTDEQRKETPWDE